MATIGELEKLRKAALWDLNQLIKEARRRTKNGDENFDQEVHDLRDQRGPLSAKFVTEMMETDQFKVAMATLTEQTAIIDEKTLKDQENEEFVKTIAAWFTAVGAFLTAAQPGMDGVEPAVEGTE